MPSLLQTILVIVRPVSYLEYCCRCYGSVFRIRVVGRPPIVHVATAELAAQVYATDQSSAVRGAVREFFQPVVGTHSIVCLDGDQWLQHRKRLNPLLRSHAVADFQEDVAAAAVAEIERWPFGVPFALRPRIEAILLEMNLRVIFGVRDDARRAALRRLLARLISASTAMMATPPSVHRAIVRSKVLTRLLLLPTSQAIALRQQVDEFLTAEIAARCTSPDPRARDLLSLLLHGDGVTTMSEPEIRDELIGILGAGHHTTATALTWAFEELARHPGAITRLRGDIARGDDRYLDAVVKETLRIRPVVPTAARRLTSPITLGGYSVPAGWLVTPSIPLLHRDPATWPQSEIFRPERFLDGGLAKRAAQEWMPFGGGLRMCIGMHLATLEIKVVLREVLTRMRLTARSTAAGRSQSRNSMLVLPRRARVVVAEPFAAGEGQSN